MKQADKIKHNKDGTFFVPEHLIVPFIEGDGIGPDIWSAARSVFDRAVEVAYKGIRKIKWLEVYAGEKAYDKKGSWLPDQTVETIKKHTVAIKGPLTTPVGKGVRSLNVRIRQALDLYACVRPVKYIDTVPSPMKNPEKINMVVFRENIEDLYAGIEWESGSKEALTVALFLKEKMKINLPENTGIGIKPISEKNTKRLVARAINYAIENGLESVTLMHKGNIMKYTEGAFCKWGYKVAIEKFKEHVITEDALYKNFNGKVPAGKVIIKDRIADMLFQQVLLRPDEYQVIATPNLNGDYISDALAAQIGGLGMAPGANMGDRCAVFEATHGTAPKYAGADKVNPTSLILSGAMMFEYINWSEVAAKIRRAVQEVIKLKTVTYDLARQIEDSKKVKCSEFAELVLTKL